MTVFFSVINLLLAAAVAIAANAATSQARWPGILDELRQDPWPWVGVLLGISVVAIIFVTWLQVHPRAGQDDPPPPPPAAVPEWFVARSETRQAVNAVGRWRVRPVGITTGLSGAGGFGKTTLATAVCAHWRVRWLYRRRIYMVTIGRDVRGRAAVAAKVAEVTRFITGDTVEFDDPDLAGQHLGGLLDERPRTLLVLDDVWEDEQLAPFRHIGRRCVRLITTRNPSLLPSGSRRIHVDQMAPQQARALLTWRLPSIPADLLDDLLQATGRWALLLRLTNRLIAEQTSTGADPADAARTALRQLRTLGPAMVDDQAASWGLDDPRERNRAVKATIEAATQLLPPGAADRFTELAIFAEDEAIPVALVSMLWQATAGLTETQTRTLCATLERLSLIALSPAQGGRISVHDVIRDYFRANLGDANLSVLHSVLIDKAAATLPAAEPLAATTPAPSRAWWQLPDGYLVDHLIEHLQAAGRTTEAEAAAGDIRWVEARITQRGPTAPLSDLAHIGTPQARAQARSLARAAHLLTPTEPERSLVGILYSRLQDQPEWREQVIARQTDPAQQPVLSNQWPLPDVDPALQRILTGHDQWSAQSVAISPDGTWLATSSYKEVRIWDRVTGRCTATLTGHRDWVNSVAISPDGTWLATSDLRRVQIWDRATGTRTATLTGHDSVVPQVAISPDGTWLATICHDKKVRIWDRVTGRTVRIWDRVGRRCTATLTGHTDSVQSVAISPDGTWLATGGNDKTVRIWNRETGRTAGIWDRVTRRCTATLTGHTDSVQSVAISPDTTWLATGGNDKTVRIWNRATGRCTATLTGHTGSVASVAISPDGTWLASTGDDGTVRIWIPDGVVSSDARRVGSVSSIAISADGAWLATGGGDGKVRIWDRVTGRCTATLTGHRGWVSSVVISPDGTWLATSSWEEVRIWDRVTGRCTATITG
ncbi:NB-ARC domain-containing protein, partial [Streptomyces sp. NPDC054841]